MSPVVKLQPLAPSKILPSVPSSFPSQFQLSVPQSAHTTTYNLPIVSRDHHCNSSCVLFSLPGKKLSKRAPEVSWSLMD